VLLALLAGCAGEVVRAPREYVVRPGDTLYSIAWRNDLDYRRLAAWNHIGPGYQIFVGERLRLRQSMGGAARAPRSAAARSAGTPAVPPAARRTASPVRGVAPRNRAPPPWQVRSAAAAALRWTWPTPRSGPVRRLVNGALLIPGKLDQVVRAAAAGRVVYTGSGIRGFGLLVIIKHSASVLSAYAYNASVTVRQGEEVGAGAQIARMGEDAHGTPMLYFEIRADGRTIDPLPYLPGGR